MRTNNIPKLVLFSVLFILLASVAYAAECSGTFSGPTEGVYPGNTFTLTFFNAEAGSAGGDVLLDVPGGVTNLSTNPVIGISPFAVYSWDVVASADAVYQFSVNMTGPVVCEKNFSVTVVDNVSDPNITIAVQDMIDVVVDQDFTYSVDMTNNGPGDAQNIVGIASAASGASVSPSVFALANLANGSTDNTVYTVSPVACGIDQFNVQIQNYEDLGGEDIGAVFANDGFTVIGSDLGFLSFTGDSASIIQGESVGFTANVRNIGTMNASSGTVSLDINSTHLADLSIVDLGIAENTALVYTYTAGATMAPGNYVMTAQITTSNECDTTNNIATFALEVTQGTCGDGITNNGEECDGQSNCKSNCQWKSSGGSGGGGGSGSHTIDIVLTEETPSATALVDRGDVIRLSYDGKIYTFRFPSIFRDFLRVELSNPNEKAKIDEGYSEGFDIDVDGEDDILLEVISVAQSDAEVRFSLIGVEGAAGRQPVPILDFPAPRQTDRTVVSAPVESGLDESAQQPESLLRGFITFMEEFDVKNTVPVWAGALLAIVIVGLLAGGYLFFTRKS